MHALHRRIYTSVEEDVETCQRSDCRVHTIIQRSAPDSCRQRSEDQSSAARDESTNQWAVLRARHHGVPFWLVEHVECVGGGAGEGCAEGEKEERECAQ